MKSQKIIEIDKNKYCVCEYFEKITGLKIKDIIDVLDLLKEYLDIYPYFTFNYLLEKEPILQEYLDKLNVYCLGSLFWNLTDCYCVRLDSNIILTKIKNCSKLSFIKYLMQEKDITYKEAEEIAKKEYCVF